MEGNYQPNRYQDVIEWEIICQGKAPLAVIVGNETLMRTLEKEIWETEGGFYFDMEKNRLWLKDPLPHQDHQIILNFQAKDLISI